MGNVEYGENLSKRANINESLRTTTANGSEYTAGMS